MTRRAYSPRQSTVDLIAAILARPGVAHVMTIAPHRSAWSSAPTKLRVTLEPQGANPKGARTDFTLPEARQWLANDARMWLEGQERCEATLALPRGDYPIARCALPAGDHAHDVQAAYLAVIVRDHPAAA